MQTVLKFVGVSLVAFSSEDRAILKHLGVNVGVLFGLMVALILLSLFVGG